MTTITSGGEPPVTINMIVVDNRHVTEHDILILGTHRMSEKMSGSPVLHKVQRTDYASHPRLSANAKRLIAALFDAGYNAIRLDDDGSTIDGFETFDW